jgi:hypothetical protein
MNGQTLPQQYYRSPQRNIDDAPRVTPIYAFNNLMAGTYHSQQIPLTMLNRPRMIPTTNQNFIGRHMLSPEMQNFDEAYQPSLENIALPLDQFPLRNVAGIQRAMFSKY